MIEDMQGKTINGFTLLHLLGVGGMAEVWYAENEIGLKAAVKILSEELSHNAQMQERFLNEAKVMVKLDHPNIRKVHLCSVTGNGQKLRSSRAEHSRSELPSTARRLLSTHGGVNANSSNTHELQSS